MKLIEAERKILALKQPVLQTQDVAACLGVNIAHASKMLHRLVKEERFFHLMRGRWATTKNLDPLILPEYLTQPFPSYISLQTALFYHGIISQIPNIIYAVTLARTHRYSTILGTVSLHHVQPALFFDFELVEQVKIATPEKALIDMLYLSPAKSRLFHSFPEIDLSNSFDFEKALSLIKKIPSAVRRQHALTRLHELINKK